ncbi:unnamed protein product [Diabrotica balteata]|uniref:CHK kinase-like domain-containing protein n=1 Tax=Diabrotica balteata TaxID=107213 RepID=A0A9N9T404_DIABA|nr:unnamed protein product [Diabrotica balteata]
MEPHEILAYIRKALQANYYTNFAVELEGKTKKNEGYVSDMIFAKIRLADTGKNLHLAIKFSKKSLRKFEVYKNIYKHELLFYTDILELFNEHQIKQNVSQPFHAVPKCFATFSDENADTVFLDNLYKHGFVVRDRNLSMDLTHLELLMKTFAKFHALSLSLKEQQNKSFLKLLEDDFITKKNTVADFGLQDFFNTSVLKVANILKGAKRTDLSAKFEALLEKGMPKIISDILNDTPEKSVIIHCDGHNNNIMFKYKDNAQEEPIDIALIDWQLLRYHSPVLDLSFTLYSVASKPEITESSVLLKYYHEELSKFLTELGNDTIRVFPYSVLMDHWRKYSLYGFAYACCYMDFNFVELEDAPSLDNLDDISSVSQNLSVINLENNIMYTERLIAIVEHYFNNIDL